MSRASRSGLGTNQESIRRHNLGTLLRQVHRRGQCSRAEITKSMGLNRSTIAGLVGELESLGVLESSEAVGARQGAGRPSVGVSIAPRGPFVVAVDLGVDRMTVARVGLGGQVEQRAERVFEGTEPWQVGATVAALIRQVVQDASPAAPMVGIGIAVPGMVRTADGLVRLAPNLDWHDVSFADIVRAALALDVPVALANDGDLGALAEHERGVGTGVEDLIFVCGNVGVGAGVIAGGRQLKGASGYAGEIGHLRSTPDGRPCHCGNLGCWEVEVGGIAIAEALGLPREQVPRLGEILDGYDRAPKALRAIGLEIGHGLAGIINAFNPQVVVLGGYFRALYTLLREEIDSGIAERALPASFEAVTVTLPLLGADAILHGAAEMAFGPLFIDPVAALGDAMCDVGARLAG